MQGIVLALIRTYESPNADAHTCSYYRAYAGSRKVPLPARMGLSIPDQLPADYFLCSASRDCRANCFIFSRHSESGNSSAVLSASW
jgi:hypothetical protein